MSRIPEWNTKALLPMAISIRQGYRGRDMSGTGWGMKWDFIIIHESGHEWFGNNITTKDIADMWVHEGFTNYSETLFTDYISERALPMNTTSE